VVVNNGHTDAVAKVMELAGGLGADVAIEAVGVPDTFERCTELIRPGGRVANAGVHGTCARLHLEKRWTSDVTITTGLVDATRRRSCSSSSKEAGSIRPLRDSPLPLAETEKAYGVFGAAAETHAIKVVLEPTPLMPETAPTEALPVAG
jgi:alcohol dehydrogenase